MNTIKDGVESLSHIAALNFDRFIVAAMVCSSLFAAGYMVSF